jgi:molybdate/tungstate transport system ATP-binding protein
MSGVMVVEDLSLRLGAFALKGLDLEVAAGEILVLLGPNGAGKSVTLETIAGFHRPRTGRIVIAGRDVTRLQPERRHVGLVLQNFALFPHLSVAGNVAIAERRAGAPAMVDTAVPFGNAAALLSYFSISHLAGRKPQDLSAGERQRTSLARAFAARPDVLLFDEPFSALDAPTRAQLRRDLAEIVRAAAIPAIFVTHDPMEARTLADRIAVIDDGALLQKGGAADVFERPRNAVVARLLGYENVLSGEVAERRGDLIAVAVGSSVVWSRNSSKLDSAQRVTVCIRGEDVTLQSSSFPSDGAAVRNRYRGRVIAVTNLGPLALVTVDCGFTLSAYVMSGRLRAAGVTIGADTAVEIAPGSVHVTVDEFA